MTTKSGLVFLGGLLTLSFFSMVGCGDDTTETTSSATSNMTTSSSTGTGGSGSGGSAATPDLTCDYYCTTVMDSCASAVAQYSSMEACMGACKGFPQGALADTSGNTLGCRIYHAGVAKGTPDMHCTHAGPGGDNGCGKNCEGFCAIAMSACTGSNEQYADTAACMTECEAFPTTETYDASDVTGDTLACRLYHLTVAASSTDAAAMHCPHIKQMSDQCK